VTSKKVTIYGYKLHLLITLGGMILDFELAPASADDGSLGFELLTAHTCLDVLGDKAYLNQAKAEELWRQNRIPCARRPDATQPATGWGPSFNIPQSGSPRIWRLRNPSVRPQYSRISSLAGPTYDQHSVLPP
jgi:hypothetical protein